MLCKVKTKNTTFGLYVLPFAKKCYMSQSYHTLVDMMSFSECCSKREYLTITQNTIITLHWD